MSRAEKYKDRFKWSCGACGKRTFFAFDTSRECQKDQIRHAKRYHSRLHGYEVIDFNGRVIYRVP